MTTQSSNILLVLANAVANFNGSMSDVRGAANILVLNLGINGFTTQTMGVLVPFKKSLISLGFDAELVNGFMSSLGIICDCKDKAIGKYTKQHIATIKSFLQFAAEKHAAAQQPTNEPIATTKPRELVELDECLNAQIVAATTTDVITAGDTNGLFVQTANGEWAHVQDAADEADYLDLYGDDLNSGDIFANCDTFEFDEEKRTVVRVSKPTDEPTKEKPADKELDFKNMQLEQLQDIYAAAKERDGDDNNKDSAGELVEKFAKFIYDKVNAENNEFLGLVNIYRAVVTDYRLKNVCPQFGFELSIGLLRKNANAKVFTLSCNHPNLINGFECLTEKSYHLLSDFDSFLHISRDFFRDILRKIE